MVNSHCTSCKARAPPARRGGVSPATLALPCSLEGNAMKERLRRASACVGNWLKREGCWVQRIQVVVNSEGYIWCVSMIGCLTSRLCDDEGNMLGLLVRR